MHFLLLNEAQRCRALQADYLHRSNVQRKALDEFSPLASLVDLAAEYTQPSGMNGVRQPARRPQQETSTSDGFRPRVWIQMPISDVPDFPTQAMQWS